MVKSELVDLTVALLRESDKAILVTDSTPDEAVWLPRSQVEIVPADRKGLYDVTLPRWLAEEKGLL